MTDPRKPPARDGSTLIYFAFNIHLPTETMRQFGIYHDLAELFGYEYQSEAVSKLEDEIRARRPKLLAKLDIDRESGCAFVNTDKPSDILGAALIVNDLCTPEHHKPIDDPIEKQLRKILTRWKRPKPCPWAVGDVFAAPLSDGTFAHGQVLSDRPTCALLDTRRPAPANDAAAVTSAQLLSILHLGSDLLDQGTWRVVGHADLVAPPDSGPDGDGFSVGNVSFGGGAAFVDLAEALYGVRPWNVGWYGRDDHFDRLLMPGVKRPTTAWILSPEERDRYRREHGITA